MKEFAHAAPHRSQVRQCSYTWYCNHPQRRQSIFGTRSYPSCNLLVPSASQLPAAERVWGLLDRYESQVNVS